MADSVFDRIPPGGGAPQAHGCPTCGAAPLVRVEECESVHWLCRNCGHCYQVVSRALHSVDPIACAGCASQSKDACFEVLRADFPRFGTDNLAD